MQTEPNLDYHSPTGPFGERRLAPSRHFTTLLEITTPRLPGPILLAGDDTVLFQVRELETCPLAYREQQRFHSHLGLAYTWRTTPLEDRIIPEFYTEPERFVWHVPYHTPDRLEVEAPLDLIEPALTNQIVIRFTSARLELFVDGVLIDEECPHGPTRNLIFPMKPAPGVSIHRFCLWETALDEAEIRSLAGGDPHVATLENQLLPASDGPRQYWRPPGWNSFVGDCMPYFHDGVLRMFYLYDRRHHQNKWGTGAHTFAQMTTTDLIHWEDQPDALRVDRPEEGSLGTGNCIHHDGTFYLYWIEHARRLPFRDARYHGDNMFVATGTDAVHFTKQPTPWPRIDYGQGSDINSFVFRDEANGKFYQVFGGGGVLDDVFNQVHWESDDLKSWRPTQDLSSLGKLSVCPSYIAWKGYHYILSTSFYYLSEAPPSANRFRLNPCTLDRDLAAPMIVNFNDDRALYVGFKGRDGYAGRMVIRELIQHPDGSLGLKWVPELIPATGEVVQPFPQSLTLDASNPRSFHPALPPHYRLRMKIAPRDRSSSWGFRVRADRNGQFGVDVRFIPEKEAIEIRSTPDGTPHYSTRQLPLGLRERYESLEEPHTLDILVCEDFLDLCVADRYTRFANIPQTAPHHLLFYHQDGAVTLSGIELRPLVNSVA